MHRMHVGQLVRIITIEIAVDESDVVMATDGLNELFNGDMESDNGCILDYHYTGEDFSAVADTAEGYEYDECAVFYESRIPQPSNMLRGKIWRAVFGLSERFAHTLSLAKSLGVYDQFESEVERRL